MKKEMKQYYKMSSFETIYSILFLTILYFVFVLQKIKLDGMANSDWV